MTKIVYIKRKNGEWITPQRRGHYIACCDCGLVHLFKFRIKDKKIQLCAVYNSTATRDRRKQMKRRDRQLLYHLHPLQGKVKP